MSFDSLVDKCNRVSLGHFGNADVVITLTGAAVNTIRGIFDENSEVVSPFETERVQIQPALTVLSSELESITSNHLLTVRPDRSPGVSKNYSFDGKPRPDGHGFTLIYLTGKK